MPRTVVDSSVGPAVLLHGIRKAFSNASGRTTVIEDLDLEIVSGEVLSIFGPNGCGKSTLVHLIAGTLSTDAGSIDFEPPGRPDKVGVVFQAYDESLLPWRTCEDNIALPLEARGNGRAGDRRLAVGHLLDRLRFDLPLRRYPYELSSGQRQLACVARALIAEPSLMLLDEPFASLDYKTRRSLYLGIEAACKSMAATMVFVSHDLDEAILLGDRILVVTRTPMGNSALIPVRLPRPRGIGQVSSPEFGHLRAEVLELIRTEAER